MMKDSRGEGKRMKKYGFFFAVVFLVCLLNQGNAQELSATDPDTLRDQIAKALREGNLELALQGFATSEKAQTLIPTLNAEERNLLADWLEKAQLKTSREGYRVYKTKWTDPQGGVHNFELMIVRNEQGRWIIISW
jgi:hypothetical protein